MTTSATDRCEEIRERLNAIDGRSAEAKALREEMKSLEQMESPPVTPAPSRGARVIKPASLIGTATESLSGQKTAYYWCGTVTVGTRPDPQDPTGTARIDDPSIRPHPPFFTSIIAGISFPQVIQPIVRRGGDRGTQQRQELAGEVHILREEQVERIAAEMPLFYVDWSHRTRLVKDDLGNNKRVKVPTAQKVLLRSEEYIAEAIADAKERKRKANILQPAITSSMESIAKYVYMVKVADENGRLAEIPPPVSETGIEMP